LWWTGARVTLIHRGEAIHQNVKYWIKPNIENRIKNGEIPAHFRSTVLEIGETFVRIQTPDGEKRLKNDFVFAMTGYRPDTEFLEAHGIRFDPERASHGTRKPRERSQRIYLAGVLVANSPTKFYRERPFSGGKIAEAIAAELK
jgi:thioredoxin reductase (NADPH)